MLDDTHGENEPPRRGRMSLLRKYSGTYIGYSIGCALVWAVILAAVYTQAGDGTRHSFAVFFGGWAIGWLSASIGRLVYPPPKSRTPV